MSQMLVDIKRIVEEDVNNRTTQKNALFEAITNSIQANADRIICRFKANQSVIKAADETISPKKVDVIEIEDNGDGFTDANFKSFGKYRSNYNVGLGCKGVWKICLFEIIRKYIIYKLAFRRK